MAVGYPSDDRDRDASRKRDDRALKHEVEIPACEDKSRRERLEADDIAWLSYYFGPESGSESPFTYEFTYQQREMIAAIRKAIVEGGDQALAASRGEGKTIICERMILKYTLSGVVKFSVLFAATGTAAEDSLESIKGEIENNVLLRADYPEVCGPVLALENTPNRAHYQIVRGRRHDNLEFFSKHRSKFSWCGQEIYLPNVPGSPSSGAIIATRGLDAAVRGLKKKGLRVHVAVIDDPDTEETARSPDQAKKLEVRIDRAIAGLGGQQRTVARVMLTTLQSRISASWSFTDREVKPNFHGRRFRFLVTPPERTDLWEEYVILKESDWASEETDKRTNAAHEFFIANREAMERGAEVANPNRYVHGELCALQHYYNQVARLGAAAVATEYDNDPPEEDLPIGNGLTAGRVRSRLSGYERYVVPPDCVALTRGIDVNKDRLHWVVKAWRADATNYVVDYGAHETHGIAYGSEEGVELAIRKAILEIFAQYEETPCVKIDGEIVPVGMTLVDSGWKSEAVYEACLTVGLGCYPSKGHGKSHGCSSPSFSEQQQRTPNRKPGDGWFMQRLTNQRGWLVHCDTDRWKSFEHARWLTPEGKPGAAYLFGDMTDEERRLLRQRTPRQVKDHDGFARQLTAEGEFEEVVRGVLKRVWKLQAGKAHNHYYDASYLADVAANIVGVRLLGGRIKAADPKSRPTAAQLAARAR